MKKISLSRRRWHGFQGLLHLQGLEPAHSRIHPNALVCLYKATLSHTSGNEAQNNYQKKDLFHGSYCRIFAF